MDRLRQRKAPAAGAEHGPIKRSQQFLLNSDVFTSSELGALCNYKNQGYDLSLTYKYVLSPFYNQVIKLVPQWVAPNLITTIGVFAALTAHLILSLYCPTLYEEAPRWVYFVNFLGLFTCMLFDNLDGRQARRTGSSSPLGHLFDHACDALNVVVTGLCVACTLRLGNNLFTVALVWFFGWSVFYTSTLEEFFTGALVLREVNGANEGLLVMQGFYLTATFYGTSFWMMPVGITKTLTLPLGKCILFLVVPVSLPTIFQSYRAIYLHSKRITGGLGVFMEAIKASLSFAIFTAAVFLWAAVSDIMRDHPYLFMWAAEMTFTYIVTYTIVSHLCGRHKLPNILLMHLPIVAGAMVAVANRYAGANIAEYPVLFGVMCITTAVNAVGAYKITMQICRHLNIRVFSISEKKAQKDDK
eukprot:CAMPEP_0198736174 /NCGR_PEP_ID=MMETSP1475-20131203/63998_1 /TAXON_ID= ORGANISM="Unidentified sp., Strain CCMP1999" /NCGR_SAMPLE_ID=MMETSP1475 /ASSEMBLY_ACC=CAM_ASM_001111 /LENGTH=413 /DNA_ID=CAMNT_0044499943 /DNA_START=96 /DNA_END=1337 /DNA_ORIENTATION=+